MKIVGISGSMREESDTLKAMREVLEAVANEGAETELLDLRQIKLAFFEPDEEPGEIAAKFTRKLQSAAAIVLGTPVYHGSLSGALKNALDYVGTLEGKVVAFVSISGGRPGTNAITSLQFITQSLHAISLPVSASLSQKELNDANGKQRLRTLGRQLVRLTEPLASINSNYDLQQNSSFVYEGCGE